MSKQRIQGNDLMLFDKNGHSLAFATSHTLNIDVEMQDINDKDAGAYGKQLPGKINWSISTDNIYSTDEFYNLNNVLTSKEPVKVYFGLKSGYEGSSSFDATAVVNDPSTEATYWTPDTTTYVSYGYCFCNSLSVNAASGDRATFTAEFQGSGPLSYAMYQAGL